MVVARSGGLPLFSTQTQVTQTRNERPSMQWHTLVRMPTQAEPPIISIIIIVTIDRSNGSINRSAFA